MGDIFQTRYKAHQSKKSEQLKKIMAARRSQRVFNGKPIPEEELKSLLEIAALAPSSCNRQAIHIDPRSTRPEKELLSGLLVGGVGWAHRADTILLLFANPVAYKAVGEIEFMPYLDAGVVLESILLLASTQDIGAAYINPNIREQYKFLFSKTFNLTNHIYCGAIALGYFDEEDRAENTSKKKTLLEE